MKSSSSQSARAHWPIGASPGVMPRRRRIDTIDPSRSSSANRPVSSSASGFGDRAGANAAEEEAEQSLARRRLVEHAADELRVRRAIQECLEPRAGELDAFEIEARHRGVARDELRGVQIPALIEAARERMSDVSEVHHPPRVDRGRVLRALGVAQRRDVARVYRHGQQRRRSVREADAGAGERRLNHVLREVARRMAQSLIRRRDPAGGRVVVRPEIDGGQATIRRIEHVRQQRAAERIDDRLRHLDHDARSAAFRAGKSNDRSSAPSTATKYSTCAMTVTFGTVIVHCAGSAASCTSAVTRRSSVRTLRSRSSSVNGLMRTPIDAGSVPARWPQRDLARRPRRRVRLLRRSSERRSRPRNRCDSPRWARAPASRARAARSARATDAPTGPTHGRSVAVSGA